MPCLLVYGRDGKLVKKFSDAEFTYKDVQNVIDQIKSPRDELFLLLGEHQQTHALGRPASAGRDQAITPLPGITRTILHAQVLPVAAVSPDSSASGIATSAVQPVASLFTATYHFGFQVLSPQQSSHNATALIDLQVIVGLVVAIEIEHDADAIERVQIHVAGSFLHFGDLASHRVLALRGDVKKLAIVCEVGLCRPGVMPIHVRWTLQRQRFGIGPAGVVQNAVEVRALRCKSAGADRARRLLAAIAKPCLHRGNVAPGIAIRGCPPRQTARTTSSWPSHHRATASRCANTSEILGHEGRAVHQPPASIPMPTPACTTAALPAWRAACTVRFSPIRSDWFAG